MGGSTSKPSGVDPNTYLKQAEQQFSSYTTVPEQVAREAQAKALQATAAAQQAAAAATQQASKAMFYLKSIGGFVLFAGILLAILYVIDYISITFYNKSTIGLLRVVEKPGEPGQTTVSGTTVVNDLLNRLKGGASSGDLLPNLQEAEKQTLVAGKDMPLSSDNQGGYGMQWWMFVRDWNYGYGKEKGVLSRVDPTNENILNPKITLHPTENVLKISVSVFPDTQDGSSTTQPASATGSTASTDDVFICEVPNIPLQKWFSVSVTVFGRNLDIYIDGNLVKSCLLSGVPKPATGDITLSPEGGYSGYMCNYNYFARMLTPGDASNFHASGTSCQDKVPTNGVGGGTAGTGYSLKIGTYDTSGKVIKEYTF